MLHLAMALVFAATGASEKPMQYEEAFKKADKEKKPLLIVVGARWCASCQVMKKETMQPMKDSGALDKVVVTYVDKDERPELAQKLMRGSTLPQVVVYSKRTGSWKRYSVTGMQSKKRVAELLGRANGSGAQLIR